MSKNIEQLLSDFAEGQVDRCWVVIQLEDVSDVRVVSMWIDTLTDFSEDDSVRIEILKSLVMRKDSVEDRTRLGQSVLTVLLDDDDDLIRQHAAKSLRYYPEVERVLDSLESIVCNESDDIDVRHNAMFAIETNRHLKEYRNALQRIVNIPEFSRIAQRALG